MTRTNIEIDEEACAEIMRRFQLDSKHDVVNLALRTIAAESLSFDKAKAMRGSGWEGKLDEMRANKSI